MFKLKLLPMYIYTFDTLGLEDMTLLVGVFGVLDFGVPDWLDADDSTECTRLGLNWVFVGVLLASS